MEERKGVKKIVPISVALNVYFSKHDRKVWKAFIADKERKKLSKLLYIYVSICILLSYILYAFNIYDNYIIHFLGDKLPALTYIQSPNFKFIFGIQISLYLLIVPNFIYVFVRYSYIKTEYTVTLGHIVGSLICIILIFFLVYFTGVLSLSNNVTTFLIFSSSVNVACACLIGSFITKIYWYINDLKLEKEGQIKRVYYKNVEGQNYEY